MWVCECEASEQEMCHCSFLHVRNVTLLLDSPPLISLAHPPSLRCHGDGIPMVFLSIVSGCIIIGVSKDCHADAVGGIFLGAGGLGLLIAVYPFIKAWLNVHHILPNIGNLRVHPIAPPLAPEQPADSLRREGTLGQMERSKSRMGTFAEAGAAAAEGPQEDGPSTDAPDILGRRKPKLSEVDLP
ncbi:hypothetical protein HF521_009906 [Silurus meridionalis]|uniref:Kinocilin n=1 Tax=Silurus meridionalis TaxID=175797 RepID=A0A8T0AKU7_SILME|nr:hypothetical protein HF521_009906 [Silurus meridionalis]